MIKQLTLIANEVMHTQRMQLDNALLNWIETVNNENVIDNLPHIEETNGTHDIIGMENENIFVPQNVLNSAQNIHLSSIQRSTAKIN